MTNFLKPGLLAGLFAGAMCAQDAVPQIKQPGASIGTGSLKRAVGCLAGDQQKCWADVFGPLTGVPQFKSTPLKLTGISKVCAIPLVEVQIPGPEQFRMFQIRPSKGTEATMPQIQVPAPACPK